MPSQYHVIDPTFFNDVTELFSRPIGFDWYAKNAVSVDDLGRITNSFQKLTIKGSLQSQGTTLKLDKNLNTEEMEYRFFCMSIYRIHVGDFLFYKNRWLHVESVRDYDEWGVRSARLREVSLNNYHDFEEYLKYLNGDIIV